MGRSDRCTRPREKTRRFGLNRHRHGDEVRGETERVLAALREQERISEYACHRPPVTDDATAARFSVTMRVNGEDVTARFSVTVSRRAWQRAQSRDDATPTFCFPLGTRPETIRKRILGLFTA